MKRNHFFFWIKVYKSELFPSSHPPPLGILNIFPTKHKTGGKFVFLLCICCFIVICWSSKMDYMLGARDGVQWNIPQLAKGIVGFTTLHAKVLLLCFRGLPEDKSLRKLIWFYLHWHIKSPLEVGPRPSNTFLLDVSIAACCQIFSLCHGYTGHCVVLFFKH